MAQQRRPAAGGGQIPLDDEPMDIDPGDLPAEAELAEADTELGAPADEGEPGAVPVGEAGAQDQSLLGLFQLWFTMVALVYFVVGWGVGLVFAFRGAAEAGLSALTHPAFYLVVLFWPIALWQLFWNQF